LPGKNPILPVLLLSGAVVGTQTWKSVWPTGEPACVPVEWSDTN
jgi:hypothetical protein